MKNIKVLGTGCRKCHALKSNADAAVKELNLNIEVEYVTDYMDIARHGVMTTPALVINDKVVSIGKLISTEDIIKLINKYN